MKFYEFRVINVLCIEHLLQQIQCPSLLSCFVKVPVPLVVPPQKKDMKDAAVQSGPLDLQDEVQSLSSAGDGF